MSKLIITNSNKFDADLRSMFASAGFTETSHVDIDDFKLTAYRKLNINNINYFSEGDDFIACAGTLFYKGLFGIKALQSLYDDSSSLSVTEMRKELIGSYVIAVKHGSIVRIFVDETHTYSFYFYFDGNDYILTNTYYHIEVCVKQPLHEEAFLESLSSKAIMSNHTPYKNIYKLCASEYVNIDLRNHVFEVMNCALNDYKEKFVTKEDAALRLLDGIKEITLIRSSALRSQIHFLTGGLDSRLELAMSLHNGDDVSLAYWEGTNPITNSTQEDLNISREISDKLNLPFILFNVTDSCELFSSITEQKTNKYGEYASIYASNSNWFNIFETLQGIECIIFGYFGETIKAHPLIERKYNPSSFLRDVIVNMYFSLNIEKQLLQLDGLYDFVENEFLRFYSGAASQDEAWKLLNYARFETHTRLTNFSNLFLYSFSILSQKKIADIVFSIPYAWREGNYFSIFLTGNLKKELLSFPFFSAHHRIYLDPLKQCTIEKRIGGGGGYKLLRRIIYKSDFLYRAFLAVSALLSKRSDRLDKWAQRTSISKNCLQKLRKSPTISSSNISLTKQKFPRIDASALEGTTAQVLVADCLKSVIEKD